MNTPTRLTNAGYNLTLGSGLNACMIEVAALAYEFGRLLNAPPSQSYVDIYGTSYDRLLAGSLRLAIHTALVIDKYLESFEDGVFTYECIELPTELPTELTLPVDTSNLTSVVWNCMTVNDWYEISENLTAPDWLDGVVRSWFYATPEKFTLRPTALTE